MLLYARPRRISVAADNRFPELPSGQPLRSDHNTACCVPVLVVAEPTIWLWSFNAWGWLCAPPSEPSGVIVPSCQMNAEWPLMLPITWPVFFVDRTRLVARGSPRGQCAEVAHDAVPPHEGVGSPARGLAAPDHVAVVVQIQDSG